MPPHAVNYKRAARESISTARGSAQLTSEEHSKHAVAHLLLLLDNGKKAMSTSGEVLLEEGVQWHKQQGGGSGITKPYLKHRVHSAWITNKDSLRKLPLTVVTTSSLANHMAWSSTPHSGGTTVTSNISASHTVSRDSTPCCGASQVLIHSAFAAMAIGCSIPCV